MEDTDIMMRRILGENISQRTNNRPNRSDESTLSSGSGNFADGQGSSISSRTGSLAEVSSQASTLSGSSRSYSQKSNYGPIERGSNVNTDPVRMAMKRAGLTPELESIRKAESFFNTGIVQPVGYHIGAMNPNEYDVQNLNIIASEVSARHEKRMSMRDRIARSTNQQEARGRQY